MSYTYFAIPKNGTHTMLPFCQKNKLGFISHGRNFDHFKNILNNHQNIFLFLRDPVDRFISACSYMRAAHNKLDAAEWGEIEKYGSINNFIKNGLQHFIHILLLRPQTKWFEHYNGNIEFLNFHNFNNDLKKFCEKHGYEYFDLEIRNKSVRIDEELDERSIRIIKHYYSSDYNLMKQHEFIP